jgi:hypothetical protein
VDELGINRYMVSRLIPEENYASAEAKEVLTQALLASQSGIFNHVAGKGVMEADPNGETSVGPAWRRALVHYIVNYVEQD